MSELKIPPYSVRARVRQLSEARNYNHKLLNIPEAWKQSKGRGVTVGVMDTGLPIHDDLELKASWSAIPGYEHDLNGHSTHVTGLLAARENGRGVIGIAPEVSVRNYTVLNMSGTGSINAIIEAIYRAVEEGCDIINLSLGINIQGTAWPLEEACTYAARRGVIIVSAAGNENGKIDQPAAYDCVIAVGAVTADRQRASFSNHGPQMDFAVGGVDLYSTFLNNGYAKMSGTSMACPVFSGICAVILGAHIGRTAGEIKTPINDVKDMKEHISRFAFDVGAEGVDDEYGHGIPVFHAPDKPPATTPAAAMLSTVDRAIDSLQAVRQAVLEM